MRLLFPADPLNRSRVDLHFLPEHEGARKTGLLVGVFDEMAASYDPTGAVSRVPAGERPFMLRSWMCRAEQYADIYEALQARGSRLLTSPSEYARAHHLPGWYRKFEQLTPFSVWGDEMEPLCEQIGGAAIVKDWVKSAKHRWQQACYIPNTQDLPHALRVAATLREIRGNDFTGSLVLREFEHFNGVQARTWWLKNEMRLAGPHPDHPDEQTTCTDTAFLVELQRAVARMDCAFITVDIAQRTDGVWRVVEVGDGGVSDRASSIPADSFIAAVTGEG